MAGLGEVLPILERCFRSGGIDFYLLGGLARDINLMRKGVRPQRITKDVDIAVLVPHADRFEALLAQLEKEEGFRRSASNPLAMYYNDVKVDILPFNQFVTLKGEAKALGPALADFNLQGLHEVYLHSTEQVELEADHRFRVTTMEAIILLKLLAYEDKPEWRLKDMEDVAELMHHYFDLNSEDIYLHHNDLFLPGMELEAIACRVIGRKIAGILSSNESLKSKTIRIIEDHLEKGRKSPLLLALIRQTGNTLEEVILLLQEVLEGIKRLASEV